MITKMILANAQNVKIFFFFVRNDTQDVHKV